MATEEKKRGKDRIQPATHDEFWTDDRVRKFLQQDPPEGVPRDYHILLKAYRGMLPETFERFVRFFLEAGHDLNEALPDNSTVLDHMDRHRKAGPYIDILEKAGAERARDRQEAARKAGQ